MLAVNNYKSRAAWIEILSVPDARILKLKAK